MDVETISARLRLLDLQVVDADGLLIARVDDVELDVSGDEVRAVSLACGQGALGRRLDGPLGRLLQASAARLRDPRSTPEFSDGVARISTSLLGELSSLARLTRSLADLPEVAGLERWLSAHVIGRLPGAGEPAAPADAARGSAEGRTVETAQHEVVLLSQLLGAPVHDASGRPVGMVHDLRLRATDPSADLPFGVAHSLVVDGAGWRTRLSHAWGYAAEPRSGPAVLRWLLAPAACRARAVPVSQVHSWTRPVVVSGPLEGYPTLGEQEES